MKCKSGCTLLATENSPSFPKHPCKYFFSEHRIIHFVYAFSFLYTSKPKYRHSRFLTVILRAKGLCRCQNILNNNRYLHGFPQTVSAVRPCNCEAVSETLLPKVARCIPVLSSRYTGKCADCVLKRSGTADTAMAWSKFFISALNESYSV